MQVCLRTEQACKQTNKQTNKYIQLHWYSVHAVLSVTEVEKNTHLVIEIKLCAVKLTTLVSKVSTILLGFSIEREYQK